MLPQWLGLFQWPRRAVLPVWAELRWVWDNKACSERTSPCTGSWEFTALNGTFRSVYLGGGGVYNQGFTYIAPPCFSASKVYLRVHRWNSLGFFGQNSGKENWQMKHLRKTQPWQTAKTNPVIINLLASAVLVDDSLSAYSGVSRSAQKRHFVAVWSTCIQTSAGKIIHNSGDRSGRNRWKELLLLWGTE